MIASCSGEAAQRVLPPPACVCVQPLLAFSWPPTPPRPTRLPRLVQGKGGPPAQSEGWGRGGRPDVCAARRPPAQPGQHHQQVRVHGRGLFVGVSRSAVGARMPTSTCAQRHSVRLHVPRDARPTPPPCPVHGSALHEHFPVIPEPIREYIEEVKGQLEEVANSPGGWLGREGKGGMKGGGGGRARLVAAGDWAQPSLSVRLPALHLPQRVHHSLLSPADLPLEEKAAFLKETRHAFGRTALVLRWGRTCVEALKGQNIRDQHYRSAVLPAAAPRGTRSAALTFAPGRQTPPMLLPRSGGGSLGAFHLGVVKALLEHSMLPRVLAGSSVGSIGGCSRSRCNGLQPGPARGSSCRLVIAWAGCVGFPLTYAPLWLSRKVNQPQFPFAPLAPSLTPLQCARWRRRAPTPSWPACSAAPPWPTLTSPSSPPPRLHSSSASCWPRCAPTSFVGLLAGRG